MSVAGAGAPGAPWARLRVGVVTCSTRAAAGVYPDRGGETIAQQVREWGGEIGYAVIVPDGPEVARCLRVALGEGLDLIVTTGGTGLTPSDGTPEATVGLLDREIPGIAEAIRAAGVAAGVPTAMVSRGVAGVAGSTLVVNLPGSVGGVRDALRVLENVVPHAVSQLHGGDH